MNHLSRRNFVALALSSLGAMLLPKRAAASEGIGKIKFTEDKALEIADRFADAVSGLSSLRAISARKFFDESVHPLGYIVDYVDSDMNPHGYIVFDVSDESLIAEFSFDQGVSGPFVASDAVATCSVDQSSLLIKTSPFMYALCSSGESAVDCYGNEIPNPLAGTPAPTSVGDSSWADIFLGDAFNDSYEIQDYFVTNRGFCSYAEKKVENCTGSYACAVVALMNCATPYCRSDWPSSYSSKWVEYYNEMWRLAKTSIYNNANGIRYGSVKNSQIGPALVSFCSSRGVQLTYTENSNPTFDQFKATVNRSDLSIFTCGINVDGEREGHAMAVHGCAVIKQAGGRSSNINVLLVADGWADHENTNAKYLNFAFARYTDTTGVFFD